MWSWELDSIFPVSPFHLGVVCDSMTPHPLDAHRVSAGFFLSPLLSGPSFSSGSSWRQLHLQAAGQQNRRWKRCNSVEPLIFLRHSWHPLMEGISGTEGRGGWRLKGLCAKGVDILFSKQNSMGKPSPWKRLSAPPHFLSFKIWATLRPQTPTSSTVIFSHHGTLLESHYHGLLISYVTLLPSIPSPIKKGDPADQTEQQLLSD